MLERFVRCEVDLSATFFPMRRGTGDPTTRIGRGEVWRASRTPEGPATVRFASTQDGVAVNAWGDGAAWIVGRAPDWLGLADRTEVFEPASVVVHEARRRARGLRIPRTGLVVEHLVPSILEQKVTGREARRAYRRMSLALAEPAPGPSGLGLVLPPDPARLARLPYYAMHPFGIEKRRADVIRSVCAKAAWIDATASMPQQDARTRLLAFPGIGPWTVAEVSRLAFGDADAVSVGDFHVPHLVVYALAGEPRATDERMLELLEPYRPFRGLVQLLLERSGARAPAFGPRMDVRAIERI
ncbi:MAG: DNA-3-methyladenine glycosylase family protein [Actinomycetota bacterium]